MITHSVNEKTLVLWQEWGDDSDLPGEPAIVLTKYNDSIEITQEGRQILISTHEVKAFIKALKELL